MALKRKGRNSFMPLLFGILMLWEARQAWVVGETLTQRMRNKMRDDLSIDSSQMKNLSASKEIDKTSGNQSLGETFIGVAQPASSSETLFMDKSKMPPLLNRSSIFGPPMLSDNKPPAGNGSFIKLQLDPVQDNQEDLDDNLMSYTCHKRCGNSIFYPCSCHATCVLYDMCCENMTQDCPEVIEEGHKLYSDYFGQELHCEEQGIYMLTKSDCSSMTIRDQTALDTAALKLQYQITNAPVTDSESGLTYLNKDVYDCYRQSFNLSNEPEKWSYNLEYFSSDDFHYIVSHKSRIDGFYEPSFDLRNLSSHLCAPNKIRTCENASVSDLVSSEELIYYSEKCLEFTAVVESSNTGIKYHNRYCAYCFEGRKTKLIPVILRVPFRSTIALNVLMTMSGDGEYLMKFDSSLDDIGIPSWAVAKCESLDGVITELDKAKNATNTTTAVSKREDRDTSCGVVECNVPFTRHSDNICKANYHMLVGFKDNELGLPPLACPMAAQQIGDFISCSLGLSLKGGHWDYVEKMSTASVSFGIHSETNETFYFVELSFLTALKSRTRDLFSFGGHEDDMIPNLHKLATVIKAYHLYRLSTHICAPLHFVSENNIGLTAEPDALIVDGGLTKDFLDYLVNSMVPFRGPIQSTASTTVNCFSAFSPVEEDLNVACINDAMYVDDVAQASDLLNTCVAYLEDRRFVMNNGLPHFRTFHSLFLCLAVGFVNHFSLANDKI